MCACVKAKWPSCTKVMTILTTPHEWIGDYHVRIRVAYATNLVSPGRRSKLKKARIGAHKYVSVIWTATAIINAKRVANRNSST